ncbi:MAG: right-handed parallel beta-helix repeat-containing protein, partial [Thermoplasmata archaeon]|nr:right-handed parallel beta-helix repeat-containing protein [Thermoplasmata archaeon]
GEGSIEWKVDGRAELLNSTLDLNGSLEVLSGGEIDMINSTLRIQNPLTNGTHGIEVLSGGGMRVVLASRVMAGSSGLRYHWTVRQGGLLVLDGATVSGAGWSSTNPGLIVASSGNTMNDTTFTDCYVGLTVTGTGNDGNLITFRDCVVGAQWMGNDSNLTGLVFLNCTTTGLHLEQARNVSLVDGQFNIPEAEKAVYAYDCAVITLTNLTVDGARTTALELLRCSDVRVSRSDLKADGYVVRMDGVGSGSNLTFEGLTIENASYGMFLNSSSNVKMLDLTISTSIDGIYATGIEGLLIDDCMVAGTEHGVWIVNCSDVTILSGQFIDSGTLLNIVDTDDLDMGGCLLRNGNEGLLMVRCSNVSMTNLTVIDTGKGLRLDDAKNVSVLKCIVDTSSSFAVDMDG